MRLLESAVAGDFDALAGYIISGKQPLVVKGFTLDPSTVGATFTNLKVVVAGSALMHFGASESGTVFIVPTSRAPEQLTSTNSNVSGSFTTGTDNFVGLDLVRKVDNSTNDRVAFLSADTKTETGKTVPLGRTLNYSFVISTRSFSSSPNVLPLAIVSVDVNGFVTKITDARRLMFRLGSGGDVPNPLGTFAFSQRFDSPNFTTTSATNPFIGGDKDVSSQKQWQDAVMTRLWEIGGGEYWYSQTASQDVLMVRSGTTFTNGDYFEVVAGHVHWRGLSFAFANSTAKTSVIADQLVNSVGLTDLAVGECVYADLDRSTDAATATVAKTTLTNVRTSTRPGNRYVFVWRTASGYFSRGSSVVIGTTAAPATTTALGVVQLSATPSVPATPVAATVQTGGAANVTGLLRDARNLNGTGGLSYTASAPAAAGVAHILDNTPAQTSGKILSVRTGAVEKASIDFNGLLTAAGVSSTTTGTTPAIAAVSAGIVATFTTTGATPARVGINLPAAPAGFPSAPVAGDVWQASSFFQFNLGGGTAGNRTFQASERSGFTYLTYVGNPGNVASTTYFAWGATSQGAPAVNPTAKAFGQTSHMGGFGGTAYQLSVKTGQATVGGTVTVELHVTTFDPGPIMLITIPAGTAAGAVFSVTTPTAFNQFDEIYVKIINGAGVTTSIGISPISVNLTNGPGSG